MPSPLLKPNGAFMRTSPRALPYLLSWGVLAILMTVGMHRTPSALYAPIDGDWAKWNVEAILHFGKIFDLSPYSMLAGMGSMYFPNLPWLNPGALALGLPFGSETNDILSYAIYATELAVSTVILARVIGFSWLMATAAAQLYIYLLFPPFSEVFQIYPEYPLAPYYAHLTAALNGATALLLACGRVNDWRGNASLAVGFLALFISGLLSAPVSFVLATPAYIVITAAVIFARRPTRAEWAWKAFALCLCLLFFFSSGLLNYYFGTMATAVRTPTSATAWGHLLSLDAWIRLLRDHSLCQDPRLLLCVKQRGAWLLVAALTGTAVTIVRHRGDMRIAGVALAIYISLVHLYAYAYQAGWLGPAEVLSNHFLILSGWSFICMFAVVPFFEMFRLIKEHAYTGPSNLGQAGRFLASVAFATLLIVTIVHLLRHPYLNERYRPAQLVVGVAAIGALILFTQLLRAYRCNERQPTASEELRGGRRVAVLSIFPVLALVHLSLGVRDKASAARDPSLEDYLRESISIEISSPFRGYAVTIWMDGSKNLHDTTSSDLGPQKPGIDLRKYYLNRFDETFYLWRAKIPTLEEYGQWTSAQAHAFTQRLLGAAKERMHINYLRAFIYDPEILRLLGVRFVLTNIEALDDTAVLRGSVTPQNAPGVYLFEIRSPNLGTYSPTRFVRADTADAVAERIRENKGQLEQVAVVSDDVLPTAAKARDVAITVERDGVRVQAASEGPAHILLPMQFSHCLFVVNGAAARLTRANLFQTLLSFDGPIDARIEFRFGLFTDNKCRLRDGLDNKALGL